MTTSVKDLAINLKRDPLAFKASFRTSLAQAEEIRIMCTERNIEVSDLVRLALHEEYLRSRKEE